MRCWGWSYTGQRGLGTIDIVGDDEVPTVDVDLGPGGYATAVTSGTATDNLSVTSVEVTIYRRDQGGQYWNGKDWQSAEVSVTADLASPMSPTTTWTYSLATKARGSFRLVATATDSFGNVGVTNRQSFSI